MSLVRILALQVEDEESYARYRAEMAPLLTRFGGEFLWDFRVSATLRASCPHAVNRIFALAFADAARGEAFFADPAYRAVRARWFEPAVSGWTVLARFEEGPKPDSAS